ncbi:unnamed protein product, partial [Polarella glacialis]
KHVLEMHGTYARRYKEWHAKCQSMNEEIEVQQMGLGDFDDKLDFLKRRPRPIELDRLPDLYEATYDAWINNGFRELVHSRKRSLRVVFDPWRRVCVFGELADDTTVARALLLGAALPDQSHIHKL